MKIIIEKYNPKWVKQFENLKNELASILKFLNPKIEHIGSTSVPSLSANPIIDIAIGINNSLKLDLTVDLINNKIDDIISQVHDKAATDLQEFLLDDKYII